MVIHTALGSLEVEDLLLGPRCPQSRFLARSNLQVDGECGLLARHYQTLPAGISSRGRPRGWPAVPHGVLPLRIPSVR
jgi:hypothetical protein